GNSWGVGHGGVVMALLDVAMARAGRSLIERDGRLGVGSVTVEMKTSFFRPARGTVVAHGRVLHRSTTMTYCEAELVDAGGVLVAKALGTIKFLTRPDAAQRL
ncbi:MAG: PaaI family thioesterase, partial [Betaproteobacteria bacterium]